MNERKTELLKNARELLNLKGWTTGELARDAEGNHVSYHTAEAACFCAIGALRRANYDSDGGLDFIDEAVECLHSAMPKEAQAKVPGARRLQYYDWVSSYNDADINDKTAALAWFDRAIALSEGKTEE